MTFNDCKHKHDVLFHLLPDAQGCRVSWAMMAEVGGTCFPQYLSRRFLPDVCGYPVSRIASVDVCSAGNVLGLPSLAYHLLFPNFWG